MAGGSGQLVGGRYRLAEPIGHGGMGVVWRAHDEVLGRDVAVKEVVFPVWVPDREQRLACARSIQEARAAGRLNHPGVITVHDVVEDDGRPWIVMELFRGGSLADLIDKAGPLPPRRAAEIGLSVLDALCTAHAAGIVHRDLKPANVLVNGSRVVLTDFGAAAIQSDPALTGSGPYIGTPEYMAPERARQVRASPASDLWSLGATLYAAVEGRPPYTGPDALAVLSAVLTTDPPPPDRAGPLTPVVMGLMCRDMKLRLTAAEARDLLARVAGSVPDRPPVMRTPTEPALLPETFPPVEEVRPETAARPVRPPERSWVMQSRTRVWLLAAVAIVAAGITVAISLSGGSGGRPSGGSGGQPSGGSGGQPSGSSAGQPLSLQATFQDPINAQGTSNAPRVVTFGQGGTILAVGSVNTQSRSGRGPTYLWDVGAKRIIRTFTDPRSRGVYSVAFCGRTLAVGDRNGKVYLWDAATRRMTGTLTDPGRKGEHLVAFGWACRTLAVGGGNGKVYLWNVSTGSITKTLTDPGRKRVSSLAYARDGRTLAVGDGNGRVYLWDVHTRRITATATFTIPRSGGILSVASAPAGTTVAAAGGTNGNSKVYLWDAATKRITGTLGNPAGQVIRSLAFGPDGTTLAVGGSYGKVYLWDAATKRIIAILAPHAAGQRMNSLAFGAGGTTLAAVCSNGKVYVWKITNHAFR